MSKRISYAVFRESSWAADTDRLHVSVLHGRGAPTILEKNIYAVGRGVDGTIDALFIGFGLIYWNQVVGLSGSLSGVAVAVSTIFDAVTDPLVGNISDNHSSGTFGRRHPFMYFAAIPAAASTLLLYQVPNFAWSQALKFVWMQTFLILARLFMTLYAIPHLSLGAELAPDYHERTSIMGWVAVWGYNISTGWLFVAFVFLTTDRGPLLYTTAEGIAVHQYESGLLNPNNYSLVMFVSFIIIFVSAMVAAIGTQHFVPYIIPEEGTALTPTEFVKNVVAAFKHRSFKSFCIGFLFAGLAIGVGEVLVVLLGTYVWGFNSQIIGLFPLLYPVAALITKLLIGPITRRIDKKPLLIVVTIGNTVCSGIPMFLYLVGWLPTDTVPRAVVVITGTGFSYLCTVMSNVATNSMLGDIADEHEYTNNVRFEGLFYAAQTFFKKSTGGLGGLVGGVLLDAIGLEHSTKPSDVHEDTKKLLVLLVLIIGVASAITSGIAYAFYDITEEKHKMMKNDLALRKEQKRDSKKRYSQDYKTYTKQSLEPDTRSIYE